MNEAIIRSIFVIISGMIIGFIIANLLYKDNKEEYYNFLKLNAIIYLVGSFIGLLILKTLYT